MATRTLKTPEIEYPTSDGKPMAETEAHRDLMIASIYRLKRFFYGRKVHVSGNLLIYYVEGDPRKSVSPDAFVVKNCQPRVREIFQIWKERRKPNFALEITSKTTRKEDAHGKKTKYALIGIEEYFLCDPFVDWLKPPLQGYRLVAGEYEPIPADAEGGVTSKELGIRFVLKDRDLTMFNAATGEQLLTDAEWETQRANEASQRANEASQRANEASQRANEASQRANEASQRANEESQRANEERRRAEEEKQLRLQAELRANALEEELSRLKEASRKSNGHNRKNGK